MDANVFIYYVVIFLEIFLRALPWILGICVLLLIFLVWSNVLEWIDEHMIRKNSVKVRKRTSRKRHSHTRGKRKRNMDKTK